MEVQREEWGIGVEASRKVVIKGSVGARTLRLPLCSTLVPQALMFQHTVM